VYAGRTSRTPLTGGATCQVAPEPIARGQRLNGKGCSARHGRLDSTNDVAFLWYIAQGPARSPARAGMCPITLRISVTDLALGREAAR